MEGPRRNDLEETRGVVGVLPKLPGEILAGEGRDLPVFRPEELPKNWPVGSRIGVLVIHADGEAYATFQPLNDDRIHTVFRFDRLVDDIRRLPGAEKFVVDEYDLTREEFERLRDVVVFDTEVDLGVKRQFEYESDDDGEEV